MMRGMEVDHQVDSKVEVDIKVEVEEEEGGVENI